MRSGDRLEDKVAVITGGTRGIGLETVRVFKKNKADVILFGFRKESVDKAIEILKSEGLNVEGYYPNLNDYSDIERTIKEIIDKYGAIDILVNNAGISADKKIDDTKIEEFNDIMNLNVRALFLYDKSSRSIYERK